MGWLADREAALRWRALHWMASRLFTGALQIGRDDRYIGILFTSSKELSERVLEAVAQWNYEDSHRHNLTNDDQAHAEGNGTKDR